jgi:ECF transporter S component (folate family)
MNSCPTVFSAEYWNLARRELHKPAALALGALVSALIILLGYFRIPLAENLNIYITFLAQAVGGALYGPVMGMLVGAVSDTLGFAVNSGGYPYFPGYLVTDMLAGLFYGLLWRRRITVLRLITVKAAVNGIVNVLLGSLWSMILYGKAYFVYFWVSLAKNAILLPLEVLLLVLLFAALIPPLLRAEKWPGPAPVSGGPIVPFLVKPSKKERKYPNE